MSNFCQSLFLFKACATFSLPCTPTPPLSRSAVMYRVRKCRKLSLFAGPYAGRPQIRISSDLRCGT